MKSHNCLHPEGTWHRGEEKEDDNSDCHLIAVSESHGSELKDKLLSKDLQFKTLFYFFFSFFNA